jgi:hypothetical protein
MSKFICFVTPKRKFYFGSESGQAFGRVLFYKIATTNAAREGANFISRNPDDQTNCSGTPSICYQETIAVTMQEALSSGLTLIPTNIVVSDCCTTGSPVTVTISKSIGLMFEKVLILFKIVDGPIVIHSAAEMMVQ